MSFLDEPDKQPRPPGRDSFGRSRSSGGGPRRPPRGPGTDRQTLARRRAIGFGAGVVLVILVALLVRGCLDARKERAFEGYVQEVSSLVAESGQESEAFFELLQNPGDLGEVDVQNTVNGLSVDAQRLAERARATDAPDELAETRDEVVQVLELRSAGLGGIAQDIPPALGDDEDQREEAVESIAREMQTFLASDVIYAQQVLPQIEEVLVEQDLTTEVEEVPESKFLPGIDLLQPETVADAVEGFREGEDPADERASPGLHGNGLAGVLVQPGGQELVEGAATEVPLDAETAFEVQVQNQGENDEEDVGVTVTLEGSGKPIELEETLDAIAAGETETVTLPLEEEPPTDEELTATVAIEPVAGEEVTDNNEGSFGVIFTGAP